MSASMRYGPIFPGVEFSFLQLGELTTFCRVDQNNSLRHRLFQAIIQQRMDTPDHSGAKSLIFQFDVCVPLHSPILLEVIIKFLNLNGTQLVWRDFSDSRHNVVVDSYKLNASFYREAPS